LEKVLVDILHEHKCITICFIKARMDRVAKLWNMMVKHVFSRHAYVKMTKSQIQDKETDLKREYMMLKEAHMQSGVGWDEN
jgi:hypothetical protein